MSEKAHTTQFADDCLLYYSDSEAEIAHNRSQKILVKW